MGARAQGRKITGRTVRAIDGLTVSLGSVEGDMIAQLRGLRARFDQLDTCLSLLGPSSAEAGAELGVSESARHALEPLVDMVALDDINTPPFSPDFRQRIGYATALLSAMRCRVSDRTDRVRTSVVKRLAKGHYGAMHESWTTFRTDPSLDNLGRLESRACSLSNFYWALGLDEAEPRVRAILRLCELLDRAADRDGDLNDVPALVRELNQAASELTRPSVAEHWAWIESVR